MLILSCDTSSEFLSVALLENDKVVAKIEDKTPFSHNKLLLPSIKRILEKNNYTLESVDRLCVGLGPGSFTGLRIGVSTIKALGFASKIEIAGYESLSALALEGFENNDNISTLRVVADGKQKDFFTAVYRFEDGKLIMDGEIEVVKNEDINNLTTADFIIGSLAKGIELENSKLETYPKAEYLGKLAYRQPQILNDISFEPHYYKEFKLGGR